VNDMPGCPMRWVVATELRRDGAIVKLECGHEMWRARMTFAPQNIQCQEFPCYRGERYMGE
jgi:hypothetical protein